ncbi:ATP-grasp domain-containing protein [Streptomyces sp. NPDC006368]|uniref:ATP-grasp domain-containing protein n=1 Tax=Streptomyces sp. NPDC006368 TaxID=3156760 RepID=UPI0033B8F0DE
MRVLFPADPLRAGRPDPVHAEEVAAVRALGGAVALVDHDALVAGDMATAVARVPAGSGPYWYRGWMIPSGRYAQCERALAARGCALFTSADAYRRAHELPGWYAHFEGLTPPSVWLPLRPGAPLPDVTSLVSPLGPGPAVVKDYVKSRKHEWDEACYVPELSDRGRFAAVAGRFLELQGDDLAGGLVIRRYEEFTGGTAEARVWWVDGEPALATAHPDTPDRLPAPRWDTARTAVRALGCRFVTTDFALRADGVWRVVEVGDGQVSGLPAGADGTALFRALLGAGDGPAGR